MGARSEQDPVEEAGFFFVLDRWLVDGGAASGRLDFADEDDQRNHAGAEDAQDGDDVQVGEHGRLAMELVVDEGLRGLDATEVLASSKHGSHVVGAAVEEWFEAVDLLVEGAVAG